MGNETPDSPANGEIVGGRAASALSAESTRALAEGRPQCASSRAIDASPRNPCSWFGGCCSRARMISSATAHAFPPSSPSSSGWQGASAAGCSSTYRCSSTVPPCVEWYSSASLRSAGRVRRRRPLGDDGATALRAERETFRGQRPDGFTTDREKRVVIGVAGNCGVLLLLLHGTSTSDR